MSPDEKSVPSQSPSDSESPDTATEVTASFAELGLPPKLVAALTDVGYETPSPIQARTIPSLLSGRDVLGLAQTGTGKTAAFALPILARLNNHQTSPQALVLTPTRELAIQVAEAFQRYAAHLPNFHVLPVYGGQSYRPQLHGLKRGAQVVVGTPGRVIDHLDRGTLDLSELTTLVLDEADEMLTMGFVTEVERVLKASPPDRQVALFSATMPSSIRRIADTHQRDPVELSVRSKTTTAANIEQRFWPVSGLHKLDALTRILEVEPFDAMLIFVRTKQATEELASKLAARGFDAAAINGDIVQQQRERTINQLREGKLDILVGTDVAARGLDVDRISHVLNYDIPNDVDSYVHRIGRTGRAGRSGQAILFVSPREKPHLRNIERATRQTISRMNLPSVDMVNDRRLERFAQRITEARTSSGTDLAPFLQLVEEYERTHDLPAIELAAALARMAHGDRPLLLDPPPEPAPEPERPTRRPRDRSGRPGGGRGDRGNRPDRAGQGDRAGRGHRSGRPDRPNRGDHSDRPDRYADRKGGSDWKSGSDRKPYGDRRDSGRTGTDRDRSDSRRTDDRRSDGPRSDGHRSDGHRSDGHRGDGYGRPDRSDRRKPVHRGFDQSARPRRHADQAPGEKSGEKPGSHPTGKTKKPRHKKKNSGD